MKNFSIGLLGYFKSILENRSLIRSLIHRDIRSRYQGSVMGIAWSFLIPVIMLTIYTFVFSVVFKSRWGVDGGDGKANFAIVMFVGLIVHGLVAECLIKAPGLIVGHVNYIKKVVFPLETLPVVLIGTVLFHSIISIGVLILAMFLVLREIPWTFIYMPFVFLPLILGTLGLTLFLSSLGVFLRDIGHLVGMFSSVLLFLSPIFYPISAIPEKFQPLMYLNPLTYFIEEGRKVMIYGEQPDVFMWVLYLSLSIFVLWLGYAWFQKTRKGFADVV